mmetsp:Transcript_3435/g.8960  ORF Transcript_3435/g.8960 Transcript_3435/m.8960 type:complete len:250 (+) Transcript_3435:77-826(+)
MPAQAAGFVSRAAGGRCGTAGQAVAREGPAEKGPTSLPCSTLEAQSPKGALRGARRKAHGTHRLQGRWGKPRCHAGRDSTQEGCGLLAPPGGLALGQAAWRARRCVGMPALPASVLLSNSIGWGRPTRAGGQAGGLNAAHLLARTLSAQLGVLVAVDCSSVEPSPPPAAPATSDFAEASPAAAEDEVGAGAAASPSSALLVLTCHFELLCPPPDLAFSPQADHLSEGQALPSPSPSHSAFAAAVPFSTQ